MIIFYFFYEGSTGFVGYDPDYDTAIVGAHQGTNRNLSAVQLTWKWVASTKRLTASPF